MTHCAPQSNISRTMQPEHIPSENEEPGNYNSASSQSSTSLKYLTYEAHQAPGDLLRFSPLPFRSRVRLGLLALSARRVRDWRRLEDITAADWLWHLGDEHDYRVV